MPTILAIDVGTTSIRGVLFDENGNSLVEAQVRCAPTYLEGGIVEQDPRTWSEAVATIVRAIRTTDVGLITPIDALSVTAQRSSVIPVDRLGEPLHPALMWQDTRSRGYCTALNGESRTIYERTGQRLSPVLLGPKICWFKGHHSGTYERAHKLLNVADYLMHFLTGRFVTDHSYGCRTLLMRLDHFAWDPELLDLFDIDVDKLCDLAAPGSIVGVTTAAFARRTGLPSGTTVVSAGGDQQCGALGAGVLKPGQVQLTSGTGSYLLTPATSLTLDREMRFLCSASALAGQYLVEASVLTTSVVYAWLGELLMGKPMDSAELYRDLEREAMQSTPGARGVLVLPHFQGSGSPDWNPYANGLFANLTLSTQRSDLIRALLEGVAAELADNLDLIRERLGPFSSISASGGLSRVALFNQISADMLGEPLQVPADCESTVRGAWMSGAVGIGLHRSHAEALAIMQRKPDAEFRPSDVNTRLYQDLRRRRRTLYNAITAAPVDAYQQQQPPGVHA